MPQPLIQATLDFDVQTDRVLGGVTKYRKEIAEDVGVLAARVMSQGMVTVPPGATPSKPGEFPHAISGDLKNDIQWAVDGDSVLVGPTGKSPPEGYSLSGAATIAEAINVGATITIRRRQRRSRSTGRYQRVRTVRINLRPRPYVDLTLEIVSRQMADIASRTPLSLR